MEEMAIFIFLNLKITFWEKWHSLYFHFTKKILKLVEVKIFACVHKEQLEPDNKTGTYSMAHHLPKHPGFLRRKWETGSFSCWGCTVWRLKSKDSRLKIWLGHWLVPWFQTSHLICLRIGFFTYKTELIIMAIISYNITVPVKWHSKYYSEWRAPTAQY